MKIFTFTIRPAGPVSFRLYHTFQASATYPLPPPSAIYGLLANAVLISERCLPQDAIKYIMDCVLFIWARANKPNQGSEQKLISSFWAPLKTLFWDVKQIKKGESEKSPKKSERLLKSNILSREFIFAPYGFVAHALIKDEAVERLIKALKSAPLYLGDSEGLATIVDVNTCEAKEVDSTERISVYFPKEWGEIVQDSRSDPETEGAHILPVNEHPHDWQLKNSSEAKSTKKAIINLTQYVFPIIKRGKYIVPTQPRIKWNSALKFYRASNCDILPYKNGK